MHFHSRLFVESVQVPLREGDQKEEMHLSAEVAGPSQPPVQALPREGPELRGPGRTQEAPGQEQVSPPSGPLPLLVMRPHRRPASCLHPQMTRFTMQRDAKGSRSLSVVNT